MAETSAPDSDPERQGQADLQPASNASPVSDGAGFARTGKALAELGRAFLKFGRALRDDVAVASRPTAKRLRALGGDAVQRLRDLDFSTAKLRAARWRSAPRPFGRGWCVGAHHSRHKFARRKVTSGAGERSCCEVWRQQVRHP